MFDLYFIVWPLTARGLETVRDRRFGTLLIGSHILWQATAVWIQLWFWRQGWWF